MSDKIACPCCGFKTFTEKEVGQFDICPVCFWEDDPSQFKNPHDNGGANPISLKQAQKNFKDFGACSRDMIENVRPPSIDESRDENWMP